MICVCSASGKKENGPWRLEPRHPHSVYTVSLWQKKIWFVVT